MRDKREGDAALLDKNHLLNAKSIVCIAWGSFLDDRML
jgi:hypothetical protein